MPAMKVRSIRALDSFYKYGVRLAGKKKRECRRISRQRLLSTACSSTHHSCVLILVASSVQFVRFLLRYSTTRLRRLHHGLSNFGWKVAENSALWVSRQGDSGIGPTSSKHIPQLYCVFAAVTTESEEYKIGGS